MKTIKEYSKEILKYKNIPSKLDDINLELVAKYGMISEIAKDLQIEKAKFFVERKFEGDKPLSDSYVNALWLKEEGGEKEIRLKYELRTLEKMMSNIRASINLSNTEARNIL